MKMKVLLTVFCSVGMIHSSFARGERLCGSRMIHEFLERNGHDASDEGYQEEFDKAERSCDQYKDGVESVYRRVTGNSARSMDRRFKRNLVLDRLYDDLEYYEMVNEVENEYAEEAVRDAYNCVFDREPDSGGMRTYTKNIYRGDGYWDLRKDLAKSSEAKTHINNLYRELLKRDADSDGMRHYTKRLRSKACLVDIREDIMDSDEYRRQN